MPPVTSLERLAGLYRKPLAAFLLDRVPDEPDPPVDYRTAWGHHRESLAPKVQQSIARARQVQHAVDEVLRSLGLEVILPSIDVDDIEMAAGSIRQALGVTVDVQMGWSSANQAIDEWRSAVERLNVVVLELSMPNQQ